MARVSVYYKENLVRECLQTFHWVSAKVDGVLNLSRVVGRVRHGDQQDSAISLWPLPYHSFILLPVWCRLCADLQEELRCAVRFPGLMD